jgi:hypothetical protein
MYRWLLPPEQKPFVISGRASEVPRGKFPVDRRPGVLLPGSGFHFTTGKATALDVPPPNQTLCVALR